MPYETEYARVVCRWKAILRELATLTAGAHHAAGVEGGDELLAELDAVESSLGEFRRLMQLHSGCGPTGEA
jgi:hypothetical protein